MGDRLLKESLLYLLSFELVRVQAVDLGAVVDTPTLAFSCAEVVPAKGTRSCEATAVDKEPGIPPSCGDGCSTNEVRGESFNFFAILGVEVDLVFDLQEESSVCARCLEGLRRTFRL